jgi:hypothetical protein
MTLLVVAIVVGGYLASPLIQQLGAAAVLVVLTWLVVIGFVVGRLSRSAWFGWIGSGLAIGLVNLLLLGLLAMQPGATDSPDYALGRLFLGVFAVVECLLVGLGVALDREARLQR